MKKAARHLLFTLLMGAMLTSFQNCSGSGSNLPSASEMARTQAGIIAINRCSELISISTATGDYAGYEGCDVTSCIGP